MKTVGLYIGSFDPFTNGHLKVLKQTVPLFDKIIVCIAKNPDKQRRFEANRMYHILEKYFKDNKMDNIEVIINSDVKEIIDTYNITHIIRGLRNVNDFLYEESLRQYYKALDDKIEMLYFKTDDATSSSLVRSLLVANTDVSKFIPYSMEDLK